MLENKDRVYELRNMNTNCMVSVLDDPQTMSNGKMGICFMLTDMDWNPLTNDAALLSKSEAYALADFIRSVADLID